MRAVSLRTSSGKNDMRRRAIQAAIEVKARTGEHFVMAAQRRDLAIAFAVGTGAQDGDVETVRIA